MKITVDLTGKFITPDTVPWDEAEKNWAASGILDKHDRCALCNKEAELRPYGPSGKWICFECAMKDKEGTAKRFQELLEGAEITILNLPEDRAKSLIMELLDDAELEEK